MILRSKRFSNTKQKKISGNFRYIMQVSDKVMVFLNFCSLHLFASFCWSKSFWEISFQIENLLSFCVDLTRISWPIFNMNKRLFTEVIEKDVCLEYSTSWVKGKIFVNQNCQSGVHRSIKWVSIDLLARWVISSVYICDFGGQF